MYIKMLQLILVLMLSPLLFGVINRTKAFFAGRKGAPLLQLYYDIFKLLRKGAVYSTTTTWIFIAGPIGSLSAVIVASMIIPFAGHPSLIAFDGDIILFIYLLGLARFFTVIAALDTGSSFEGMGASREVQFAIFAEPALFLSIAALSRLTGYGSFSKIFAGSVIQSWISYGPLICLILGALFIVLLAENSRIPVDDPNTHLELTMIHEVMALDHGGVDLAYILYGSAIKFWLLGTLISGILFGGIALGWVNDIVIFIIFMIFLAVIVGLVESALARLRLLKVPHFLIVALALSIVGFILSLRP
ncbi:MAG: NADH-quinone oxidoreductase subunit H [Chlamydiota bacterium]|nr:NADH-quinone oxidoreductase subunit H [Chlamydiota bacterium]